MGLEAGGLGLDVGCLILDIGCWGLEGWQEENGRRGEGERGLVSKRDQENTL